MKKNLLYIFMVFLFVGCQSVDVLRGTENEYGPSETFDASYEVVYVAALRALADQRAKVVEENREQGYIFAKQRMTWIFLGWTYGEWMAVYLTAEDEDTTHVKVTQRAVAVMADEYNQHYWGDEYLSYLRSQVINAGYSSQEQIRVIPGDAGNQVVI